MSKLFCSLNNFRAVLFDVDGVLSRQTVPMDIAGNPCRTVNVRDGYAIKKSIDLGITLGIITGGYALSIRDRYAGLGMKHIYMGASNKLEYLARFEKATGILRHEIIYVGDDLPDIPVLEACGLAVAPKDACAEVKAIADYISPVMGGEGVARDILEELLKAKGLWMKGAEAFGW